MVKLDFRRVNSIFVPRTAKEIVLMIDNWCNSCGDLDLENCDLITHSHKHYPKDSSSLFGSWSTNLGTRLPHLENGFFRPVDGLLHLSPPKDLPASCSQLTRENTSLLAVHQSCKQLSMKTSHCIDYLEDLSQTLGLTLRNGPRQKFKQLPTSGLWLYSWKWSCIWGNKQQPT